MGLYFAVALKDETNRFVVLLEVSEGVNIHVHLLSLFKVLVLSVGRVTHLIPFKQLCQLQGKNMDSASSKYEGLKNSPAKVRQCSFQSYICIRGDMQLGNKL